MTDPRTHLRALAESLPPGIAVPVPREWLLELRGSASTPAADPTDCYLTADQVAARLDLSVQQVYRQAKRWSFAKELSPKALRFSEAGLNRWLERRGH